METPLPPTCLLWMSLACWAPELAPAGPGEGEGGEAGGALVFVDGGLIAPAEVGAEGVALTEGRTLVPRPWTPGEEVELRGAGLRAHRVAPAAPACVLLFRLGLGDQPPTAVDFAADPGGDGGLLRIERGAREALVVEPWRGEAAQGWTGAAPRVEVPLPASCPGERVAGPALRGPGGQLVVVEGPFQERSGETGWRIAAWR
ncbi:hypothetical protein L6R53_23205 [Myxococcota bacterium]|nr:hypothetical protein [Myxococcota bacterium]